MKMIKSTLALLGTAVLLAGCASTDNGSTGAMGNGSEKGVSRDSSAVPANPDAAPGTSTAPAGANGSVSRNNPFGKGSSGLALTN